MFISPKKKMELEKSRDLRREPLPLYLPVPNPLLVPQPEPEKKEEGERGVWIVDI